MSLSTEIETKLDTFFEERKAVAANEITTKPVTRFGPVNASGRLLRSLEVVKGEKGQRKLLVNSYAYSLTKGRKPGGKMPPITPLIEWAKLRGLPDGVAFGIAKKIQLEGNTVFLQGGSELFFDTVDQKALDKFFDEVASLGIEKVVKELFEGIK